MGGIDKISYYTDIMRGAEEIYNNTPDTAFVDCVNIEIRIRELHIMKLQLDELRAMRDELKHEISKISNVIDTLR